MPCFQQPHPTLVQSFHLMRPLTDDLSKSHTIYHSRDNFVFFNSGTRESFTIPQAHHQLCLKYYKRIRTEIFTDYLEPALIRYFLMARTFNSKPSVTSSFFLFDDNRRCLSSLRPEPHPSTFFRSNLPLPPSTTTQMKASEFMEALTNSKLT